MELLVLLPIQALAAFAGYAIGRVSHIIGGSLDVPHHWVYGAVLIAVGGFFYSRIWGITLLSFGLGIFISDLKDFINLKFYGPDEPGPKKFWGID